MYRDWIILTYKVKFSWLKFRSDLYIKETYKHFDDWVDRYLNNLQFESRHGRSNWCYMSYYLESEKDLLLVLFSTNHLIEEVYNYDTNCYIKIN